VLLELEEVPPLPITAQAMRPAATARATTAPSRTRGWLKRPRGSWLASYSALGPAIGSPACALTGSLGSTGSVMPFPPLFAHRRLTAGAQRADARKRHEASTSSDCSS